eukprot:TRINITY_DN5146_c0_g1_i4.p1 TRINITY_DN5146_c0_g1~~TRINITY_DN5146_c0_g1_i4.p1  ORF type:complete len:286 (+),score=74.45 TRINITY_DN5146_c0_g1_i4:51-860(+)
MPVTKKRKAKGETAVEEAPVPLDSPAAASVEPTQRLRKRKKKAAAVEFDEDTSVGKMLSKKAMRKLARLAQQAAEAPDKEVEVDDDADGQKPQTSKKKKRRNDEEKDETNQVTPGRQEQSENGEIGKSGKAGKAGKGRYWGGASQNGDKNARKVFVGGIPFTTFEETVREDFEECGPIEELVMLKNADGNHKGIAFITFETMEGVKKALSYHGDDYGGRPLKVSMATARDRQGKGTAGSGKGDRKKGDSKGKGSDAVKKYGFEMSSDDE